jgi:hypothetical protein
MDYINIIYYFNNFLSSSICWNYANDRLRKENEHDEINISYIKNNLSNEIIRKTILHYFINETLLIQLFYEIIGKNKMKNYLENNIVFIKWFHTDFCREITHNKFELFNNIWDNTRIYSNNNIDNSGNFNNYNIDENPNKIYFFKIFMEILQFIQYSYCEIKDVNHLYKYIKLFYYNS